jgi:MYXO-CTERM domain-containing protein
MVAKRVICRVGAAVAIVLTACSPAHAFYWYDWPGSRVRVEPSLLPPTTTPGNPPSLPPIGPPPTTPPPVNEFEPPPPLPPPEQTPEPSTGLIGLLGLGAVAALRRWRSRQ